MKTKQKPAHPKPPQSKNQNPKLHSSIQHAILAQRSIFTEFSKDSSVQCMNLKKSQTKQKPNKQNLQTKPPYAHECIQHYSKVRSKKCIQIPTKLNLFFFKQLLTSLISDLAIFTSHAVTTKHKHILLVLKWVGIYSMKFTVNITNLNTHKTSMHERC